MSNRLDQEKEAGLTPKRFEFSINELNKLGINELDIDSTKITFIHKGNKITLYPYSGWFIGKGIKDGRGVDNLIKQLQTT